MNKDKIETLGDADDLISPYLKNKNFEQLESRTPRLQELTKLISEEYKNLEMHFLGQRFIKLNNPLKTMFKEFAEICEKEISI